MNILSVRNLKKYYNTGENTVKALDGIDLDICKGEFLAVVGTSGSGKSTLLHSMCAVQKSVYLTKNLQKH
mgnify:CR=1 FL=1